MSAHVNMDSSNLLNCVELQVQGEAQASVIWMHGLGADAFDFVPIVKELDLIGVLPIRFVFPNAPIQPVTINNGYEMPSWYDIISLDATSKHREDEAGLRESQQKINALIEREHQRGIPYERIVIAGFSQGGAMTLQTGLRFPKTLAGLIVLSGYLTLAHQENAEYTAENAKTPIFMGHGTQDNVVPYVRGKQSCERLQSYGYMVAWQEYRMAHSVCGEEVAAISQFLKQCLPA